MRNIKKFIKIDKKEQGEYTIEEILIKFDNLANKAAWDFYRYLQSFEMHSSHIDVEDLKQVAKIGIIYAYNKYDSNYIDEPSKEYEESIGFAPYLKSTVRGEVLKYIRDILKVRRKDYNINEIAVSSINQPVLNKDNSEMFLADIIEDVNSSQDINILELRLEINSYMKCLNDRDKNIISDSYFNHMTQKELAEKYGVTQVQIGRILKRSLEKMHKQTLISQKIGAKIINSSYNKNIHNDILEDKEKTMKKNIKPVIDTKQALNYFKSHVKDKRPLEEIMDRYCSDLEISKSELKYALHTTCPNKFNIIVDRYMQFEDKKEEKVETTINLFEGLDVVDMTLKLNLFNAIITPSSVTLIDLPESTKLSIKDLISMRDDIDKLIKLNENLPTNILKKIG